MEHATPPITSNKQPPAFKRSIRNWLEHILSNNCAFCGENNQTRQALCPSCYNELPWLTLEHNFRTTDCDKTISAFAYQAPISNLLLEIKFGKNLNQLTTLGKLIADNILTQIDSIPDAILPIPLHKQRLHTRGFNQALELARPIARILGVPLLTHTVIRHKATTAQTELSAQQRQQNLIQAFRLTDELPYQHIAIFDDVITTGTTIRELARLLRKQGVKQIEAWSCAHSVLHQKHEVMEQIDYH